MAESVKTGGLSALFASPSLKAALRTVVTEGVALAVSEKKEADGCEFGKTPGGWALLKGDFELPGWATGKEAPRKKACGGKVKIAQKGLVAWKLDFGAFPDATADNPEMSKTFNLETGIPERAYGALVTKPAIDTDTGKSTGGQDHKGRDIVFVIQTTFKDPSTLVVSIKRRVFSGSSKQVFAWESDMKLNCTVRIPKEEVESDSDDDSDGANNLLGDDSSDSESSS